MNQKQIKLGLTAKFMLFVNPLFLILGAVFALFLLIEIHSKSQERLQKKGLAAAEALAEVGLDALQTFDPSALEFLLQGILADQAIGYAIVMDGQGTVIAHTDSGQKGRILNDPLTLQALRSTQPSVFRFAAKDGRYYDVVHPITKIETKTTGISPLGNSSVAANDRGVVRVGIPLEPQYAEMKSYLTLAIIGLVVLAMAGALVSLFFVRFLISPLERMTVVASRIASGDFTHAIHVSGHDEVGVLGHAISQMSTNLKEMIKKIKDTSHHITSVSGEVIGIAENVTSGAVHQLNAAEKSSAQIAEMNGSVKSISESTDGLSLSAQDSAAAVSELSTAIAQVASNTSTLSSSVEETASSIFQMSASIKSVSENIEALSRSVHETNKSVSGVSASIKGVEESAKESALLTEKVSRDAADLGMGAMEETLEGMKKIKATVDETATVIRKLEERAGQIGKILNVIDEVTREVDLLALNAAILASQAGEDGKGFSVVAEEIKGLANRTNASTKEIDQLIKDVQAETRGAVASIKEGADRVDQGVRHTVNAKEAFNHILESTERSTQMSRTIEKATLEQVKAISQVSALMENVNTRLHQIIVSMKELETGTRQITDASERMRLITHQVKLASEEQAKGSNQISGAVEHVTQRIRQISEAINEQKTGNEVITMSISEIYTITQGCKELMHQMNDTVSGLAKGANKLNEEISLFKV